MTYRVGTNCLETLRGASNVLANLRGDNLAHYAKKIEAVKGAVRDTMDANAASATKAVAAGLSSTYTETLFTMDDVGAAQGKLDSLRSLLNMVSEGVKEALSAEITKKADEISARTIAIQASDDARRLITDVIGRLDDATAFAEAQRQIETLV